jgi:hypothetical protein
MNSDTPSDRLVGALIGAFAVVGSIVAALVVVLLLTGGIRRYPNLWGYFEAAHIWAPALVAAGGLLGYRLGSARAAEFVGHLWFTERPRNAWLSATLWAVAIATICSVTFIYK